MLTLTTVIYIKSKTPPFLVKRKSNKPDTASIDICMLDQENFLSMLDSLEEEYAQMHHEPLNEALKRGRNLIASIEAVAIKNATVASMKDSDLQERLAYLLAIRRSIMNLMFFLLSDREEYKALTLNNQKLFQMQEEEDNVAPEPDLGCIRQLPDDAAYGSRFNLIMGIAKQLSTYNYIDIFHDREQLEQDLSSFEGFTSIAELSRRLYSVADIARMGHFTVTI